MVKKEKQTKKKVHKKMTFQELVEANPEAGIKLAEKGMFCCGCPMALTETLEQGAEAHGVNADELVDELNKSKKK